MERAVIHLNIADFAVAVETLRQPALRDWPLVVAPLGAPRAVVYDMSETAFGQGIRKGMPLARARRINRDLKILPPRFHQYEQVMKRLVKEGLTFTPRVESGRLDGHIFMDVTRSGRLFGPPPDVAFKLNRAFKKQFGLDPVWSVATNKLVAKVATRLVKPAGEYIVPPGDESAFLAPLNLDLIPGLGGADLALMQDVNLSRVCQARKLSRTQLEILFQSRAGRVFSILRGRDPEPVADFRPKENQLTAAHEFRSDTNRPDRLKKGLHALVRPVGRTLRARHHRAERLCLTLSYADGLQGRAGTGRFRPTACDAALFRHCMTLMDNARTRRVRVRHLGLVCQHGPARPVQADLFAPEAPLSTPDPSRLCQALDAVRAKFGDRAVLPGTALVPG